MLYVKSPVCQKWETGLFLCVMLLITRLHQEHDGEDIKEKGLESQAALCTLADDGFGVVACSCFVELRAVRQRSSSLFAYEISVAEICEASVGTVHGREGLVVRVKHMPFKRLAFVLVKLSKLS